MQNVENDEQFLSGGGQMGALIRSMDWSQTPLGPVNSWPQSLRTSVSLCLSSTFPILIAWGPELIQIYNDSYRPICGAKHPESMGQNFKICWETALPVVGDKFDRGLAGEGTYIKDQQMLLDRYGYLEEAFMTFSFAPIRDESGEVGGIFHPITETTEQILSSRRTQVLRDLAIQTGDAKTYDEIFNKLLAMQPGFSYDIPFIQVYQVSDDTQLAVCRVSSGTSGHNLNFPEIDLATPQHGQWPLNKLSISGDPYILVKDLHVHFGSFQSGPFENAPHTAIIFPIQIAGASTPAGYLVAGVSSGRRLDQEYQNFFELFANTVTTAFSNVDAYQQQQKRAQQLAEIDRAKTAFFSNVSHEFRTPLTLILGPLQQMMDQPGPEAWLSTSSRDSMYRNAQRLLKLVNNLLDFSRLEAGRVKASFELVDLGEITIDLASNFRSVIESAGMELHINIPETGPEVYIDTDMWEKIVLNLLSNAFKYTLKGSITVVLKTQPGYAVLMVTDTGVGIQQQELPHMFERFHRIENSNGRTHEGTGIGLSLVNELVGLHQGKIDVSSVFGQGSTFTVMIPLGSAHLPEEQIIKTPKYQSASAQSQTFVREAMSLLDKDASQSYNTITGDAAEQNPGFERQHHITVLVVDDNADMRIYLEKVLSPYYTIALAVNGEDALRKTETMPVDVIVSDVMMPVMDGEQMLRHLRVRTGDRIPVILLSARAGEESRIEGLSWGADDYLVKPFSAKELVSKVNSLVKINSIARNTEAELKNIFHQAPVAIGIFKGPELIIEVANAMMLRYWGKTSDQVIGISFAHAMKEFPADGLDQIVRNVFDTGKRRLLRNWPLEVTRKGRASKIFVNLAIEPMHDTSGMLTSVMIVANDVTELIRTLELIGKSEQQFKMLANSMPQLIWRIDKTGERNFYNDYVYKYSGIEHDALYSTGLIALIHPDEQKENLIAWEKSMLTGEDFTYEHRFRRHDGQYRWHLSRAAAQKGATGIIENWVGTSTDIHDQKTLEEILENRVAIRTAELRLINDQLMRTNRELEEFAYVTSHDLQEPLRKIQIFSGIISNQVDTADKSTHDYLRRVTASAERMSHLIRDLLRFAGVANLNPDFKEVNLNQVLDQVREDYDYLIEEKQIHVLSERLPVVSADSVQMTQLFYNVLGNALKFSGKGSKVEIMCGVISYNEETHIFLLPGVRYNLIVFKDEGIGFEQHLADRIFTIFQRLHPQQNFPGTGVGLAICKRIVENHAGFIKAKSQPGVGSSFEIYIPVNP